MSEKQTLPEGSSERKAIPVATGVLDYFPAALVEIAKVSKYGNDKHNPGESLHWTRGKSNDHADALLRHLIDRGGIDPDTGVRHTAELAWRALALLQIELEEAGEAPLPRGAVAAGATPETANIALASVAQRFEGGGDPVEVLPPDSRAESQAGLNGPSGSPTSPPERAVPPAAEDIDPYHRIKRLSDGSEAVVPRRSPAAEEETCAHGCGHEATVQHADGRMLCRYCYGAEVGGEGPADCPTCGRRRQRGRDRRMSGIGAPPDFGRSSA